MSFLLSAIGKTFRRNALPETMQAVDLDGCHTILGVQETI